jgi:DNA-binding PadR family transcriptional regulator
MRTRQLGNIRSTRSRSHLGVTRKTPPKMTSPVNWALLGLVIERESYAFELATRFQRVYRNVIPLSSTSHIYTALGALQQRSLIEQIPGTGPLRQPKPKYRPTPLGVQSYGEWLVGSVREDRRRQVVFALGLSVLLGDTGAVLEVLERYDQAWRQEQDDTAGHIALDHLPGGVDSESIARALSGERQLTAAAKRCWVRQVRRELEA